MPDYRTGRRFLERRPGGEREHGVEQGIDPMAERMLGEH